MKTILNHTIAVVISLLTTYIMYTFNYSQSLLTLATISIYLVTYLAQEIVYNY